METASDLDCFGCSTAALDEAIAASFGTAFILPMSILSDAQEALALGDAETARKYMNRAKYVIQRLYGRELEAALLATIHALNVLPNRAVGGLSHKGFANTYALAAALDRLPVMTAIRPKTRGGV